MLLAAILLGLGVAGGLFLLSIRMRGANPPAAFAVLHGLAAGSGLVALIVAVLASGRFGAPTVGLIVLACGAGIGVFMAVQHAKGRLIPIYAVFVHGLVQLMGYSMVLAHFF
jgi:hypothetical protein